MIVKQHASIFLQCRTPLPVQGHGLTEGGGGDEEVCVYMCASV